MTITDFVCSEAHVSETASEHSGKGALIINADDWGRDLQTTDCIANCFLRGTVSSTSAMVFMVDSERAAEIAAERQIDAGLHLNFTSHFTSAKVPRAAEEHQHKIRNFLLCNRFSRAFYHPGLVNSFKFLVSLQIEEFARLYGRKPDRLDGHHHMHLCANMLMGKLIPPGIITRRNFSFLRQEKNGVNRLYRKMVDNALAKRYRLTDFFFSLPPLEPLDRLKYIFAMAGQYTVEVETHPADPEEYKFLMGDGIRSLCGDCDIARGFALGSTRAINE